MTANEQALPELPPIPTEVIVALADKPMLQYDAVRDAIKAYAIRYALAALASALCAEVEALRKDAERWRAYERELPDSADSTRGFLHGVAVLKAAKLAAKEPTK